MADLSATGVILPERPTTVETGAFLDLTGFLSAITGAPATGLLVANVRTMQSVAERDLLVVGALDHLPALTSLLKNGPLQVANGRLTLSLPDPFQDIRALFAQAPSRDERNGATLALDGAGEGLGVIVGMESGLSAGRSMVAVTGMTPAALAATVAQLRVPETSMRVQGDLVLFQSGDVTAFRTAFGYDVGNLPPWLWPQRWLADRPERVAMLLLAICSLIGLPLYWMLRRRSSMRLRARTPKT